MRQVVAFHETDAMLARGRTLEFKSTFDHAVNYAFGDGVLGFVVEENGWRDVVSNGS